MTRPYPSDRFTLFGSLESIQPEAVRVFAMAARAGNLAYERQRRDYREEHPHRTREEIEGGEGSEP